MLGPGWWVVRRRVLQVRSVPAARAALLAACLSWAAAWRSLGMALPRVLAVLVPWLLVGVDGCLVARAAGCLACVRPVRWLLPAGLRTLRCMVLATAGRLLVLRLIHWHVVVPGRALHGASVTRAAEQLCMALCMGATGQRARAALLARPPVTACVEHAPGEDSVHCSCAHCSLQQRCQPCAPAASSARQWTHP